MAFLDILKQLKKNVRTKYQQAAKPRETTPVPFKESVFGRILRGQPKEEIIGSSQFKAVKKPIKKTSKFLKEIAIETARAPIRVGGSTVASLLKQKQIQPRGKLEKIILGKQPIKAFGTQKRELQQILEQIGLSKKKASPLAGIGVAGLTALDIYPVGIERKAIVKQLVKETTEQGVKQIAKKGGIELTEQIAKQISKTGDKKAISQLLSRAKTEITPLLKEARKYKSAEEFVKAQGKPFYHGTDAKVAGGLQVGKEAGIFGKGVYLSDSPEFSKKLW